MKKKRHFFSKTVITLRVFGVIRSYLVCVELIIDVFRKIKKFDENFFFHDEKSQILVNNFSRFSKFLTKKKLTKFQNFEKSQKVVDQNLRFFIVKKKFSSKFLFFLKTSIISSTHTKYERLTPKTRKGSFKKMRFFIFLGIRGV